MAGRPRLEITDDLLKKAESFAAQGMTMEQIAAALGLGESTLYFKKAEYPEFAEAIKSGQAKGIATISNALFTTGKAGNVSAQIFYLKNRAGWSDKTEVDNRISGTLITKRLTVTGVGTKDTRSSD